MKSALAYFVFISACFVGVHSFQLRRKERECAVLHGMPNITYEEWIFNTLCEFPDVLPTFKKVVTCSLQKIGLITSDGKINLEEFKDNDAYKKVFNAIPHNDNLEEYCFAVHKVVTSFMARGTPPSCRGNLNKPWIDCANANGISNHTYDFFRSTINSENPSRNFKKFLLCGLKAEKVLTDTGDLDLVQMQVYIPGENIVRYANTLQNTDDKPEFAFKIAKYYV